MSAEFVVKVVGLNYYLHITYQTRLPYWHEDKSTAYRFVSKRIAESYLRTQNFAYKCEVISV